MVTIDITINSVWVQRCDEFILISSVGVQSCDTFIPTLGYGEPKWVPVKIICTPTSLSVYLYISLSLCPVFRVYFFQSKRAARNYTQQMRPQAMASNFLSGSII